MTTTTRALLAGLGLLLASGCLITRPEVPKPECEVDSECPEGEVCGPGGRCGSACKADADCPSPRTCVDAACTLPTGSCERASDCAQGSVCGLGSRCLTACTAAADCGPNEGCVGGACTSLSSGTCRFTSECPADQACVQGRCAESCQSDRDCTFGTTCQGGVCASRAPECIVASDCATGEACSPQGACVTACTTDAACAATGEACSGGACVRVGADTAGLLGTVQLAGVSDRGGLSVTAAGPNRVSGLTAADGSYRFRGLVPGLYTVTVKAAASVEGSASADVGAPAGADTTVPALTLTAAGSLRGTVTMAGKSSHEGIQVALLGTGRGTVTGPDGSFLFSGVPVGSYDLLAAYPGYQAAQAPGLAVAYAQQTTAPALALQPAPTGSTFAFSSIPPGTARVNRPFAYQAVAGGGGVASVTYGLVDGPTGATLHENTGQLTWTPSGAFRAFFTLSATGGGATVYQLFVVQAEYGAVLLHEEGVSRLEVVDGGAWTLTGTRVHALQPDGGVVTTGVLESLSGDVASVELVNGRTITGQRWTGGTISAVKAPVGTLAATWEGGTVGTVTGTQRYTLAGTALLGGTTGTASVAGADTIGAVSLPVGSLTGLDDGRALSTGYRITSSTIAAVSATGITSAATGWTPDGHVGWCVRTAGGQVNLRITANTTADFTLEADPRELLAVGDRFFVSPCTSASFNFTIEDANRAAFPTSMTGRYVDVYGPSGHVGTWPIAFTSPPPAASVTFQAPISMFDALVTAWQGGLRYALTVNGSLTEIVVTDSTAPWGSVTTSGARFFFPDGTAAYVLSAASASSLTVRVPVGTLDACRASRGWGIATTANQVPITATLTTGGLTAGALVGQSLWIDRLGAGPQLTANTANTVTFNRPVSSFPLLDLVGSAVAPSAGTNAIPEIRLPTTAVPPGAWVGRHLVRFTSDTTPLIASGDYVIARNSGSTVTLQEDPCGGCAADTLATRLTQLSNQRWAPGTMAYPPRVDLRLSFAGAPGFSPNVLTGRTVVLEGAPTTLATILGNDASTVTISVDEADLEAWRTAPAGAAVWLSERVTGSSGTPPTVVTLSSPGSTWTPGAWLGAPLILENETTLGLVTANTADTVTVSVASGSLAQLDALTPGRPFALAAAHPENTSCGSPSLSIRATATLTGATAPATGATRLTASTSSSAYFPLSSTTATEGTTYLCANRFADFTQALGKPAAFDTGGTLAFTIEDASAAWPVDALAGRSVYLLDGTTGTLSGTVTGNTATALTVGNLSAYSWTRDADRSALVPGMPFVLVDASGRIDGVLTVSPALTPSSLDGRFVWLVEERDSSSAEEFEVVGNTATEVTLRGIDPGTLTTSWVPGTLRWKHLVLAQGATLRLTPRVAAFQPDALVGRVLELGGTGLQVVSNTATTITAVTADDYDLSDALNDTTWYLQSGTWVGSDVTPAGELVAAHRLTSYAGGWRVARFARDGAMTVLTPTSGQSALTLTPAPLVTNTWQGNSVTTGYTTVFTDTRWSFTPGELVGAYLRTFGCNAIIPDTQRIIANTATTLTTTEAPRCSGGAQGVRYVVDRARLLVSGATLTPGALRGQRLWVNGTAWGIRDNGAAHLDLVYRDLGSNYVPLEPAEAGARGWVLSGLAPDARVAAVAVDATGTLWLGDDSGALSSWTGTAWTTPEGEEHTASQLAAGTVTTPTASNSITVPALSVAPNSLVGKSLVVNGRWLTIASHTQTSITTTGSWGHDGPFPGDAFRVVARDEVGTLQDLAFGNGALWAGASNGLYRRAGTAWTRYTAQSTESAPWARDGLRVDDVERVRVLPSGDVWAMSPGEGASRLRGTSWHSVTVASTESAPQAHDGLPGDTVYDVQEAAGATWLSTNAGAARWDGAAWTPVGQDEGFSSWVYGVWVTPDGTVHLAHDDGVYRLVP